MYQKFVSDALQRADFVSMRLWVNTVPEIEGSPRPRLAAGPFQRTDGKLPDPADVIKSIEDAIAAGASEAHYELHASYDGSNGAFRERIPLMVVDHQISSNGDVASSPSN